jgi:hypothetical protein
MAVRGLAFSDLMGLATGACRNCGARLSYFARRCPNCQVPNLPNPGATIAALVAVLLLGALIATGIRAFRGSETQPRAGERADESASTSEPGADYGWIMTAMAECEAEAKQKLDALYFLIVPVTVTGVSLPGWSPAVISSIGDSGSLLSATDTLFGLKNRALVLYQRPLTFAVSDPTTNTIYKWKPAVGVVLLKAREVEQSTLTLGFEIAELAKDIEWGPSINLGKGTCYWINPLIRPAPRSG